jgi:hypothetical protein
MDLTASFPEFVRNTSTKVGSLTLWMLAALICMSIHTRAYADDVAEINTTTQEEKTTWQALRSKTRMRTFSEFMTPAIDGDGKSVPETDGTAYAPTNTFNIAWVDYEIFKDWRIAYWQRFSVNFASTNNGSGVHTWARNPRFALRRTNVFNNPNITTTYDVYFQPGFAREGETRNRNLEGGFRTATSYVFPKSRWSIGAITEFTLSYASENIKSDNNMYGWVMPWASYELNSMFSTQHYFTLNFKHERPKPASDLSLDDPFPYIQNGIGMNVTKSIWAAAFINNYIGPTPSLRNTWASLWLSMTFL